MFPFFHVTLHSLTHPFIVAEEDAPSGMLARGHYTAVSTFIDDDKKRHLEFEWAFDISKDW
jgi:Rho GDP-dissociation inhibitor